MKDYGQLIAIAIGLIILLVNAGRKKKQNTISPKSPMPKSTQSAQPKTGIPSLDEILREFNGEATIPKVETLEDIVDEKSSLESIEAASQYEKYNSADYQFSYETIQSPESINNEHSDSLNYHNTTHSSEFEVENSFVFEIRDAILYSEILKRPNY